MGFCGTLGRLGVLSAVEASARMLDPILFELRKPVSVDD